METNQQQAIILTVIRTMNLFLTTQIKLLILLEGFLTQGYKALRISVKLIPSLLISQCMQVVTLDSNLLPQQNNLGHHLENKVDYMVTIKAVLQIKDTPINSINFIEILNI